MRRDRVTELLRLNGSREIWREWVEEVPVALEYNGIAYAVMMATPSDLEDFAIGFAIAEGLASGDSASLEPAVAETDLGWIVRTTLTGLAPEKLMERVRSRASESSCGLCGIENLEVISQPLPPIPPHTEPERQAVFSALSVLSSKQDMNARTGSAHAAAFANLDGDIQLVREDVGRHNAVDKLVGAMTRASLELSEGFVISTARCSYEIVEKVVRAGATCLVTVSLPTSMAVNRARQCGLTLYCLAREDSLLEVETVT